MDRYLHYNAIRLVTVASNETASQYIDSLRPLYDLFDKNCVRYICNIPSICNVVDYITPNTNMDILYPIHRMYMNYTIHNNKFNPVFTNINKTNDDVFISRCVKLGYYNIITSIIDKIIQQKNSTASNRADIIYYNWILYQIMVQLPSGKQCDEAIQCMHHIVLEYKKINVDDDNGHLIWHVHMYTPLFCLPLAALKHKYMDMFYVSFCLCIQHVVVTGIQRWDKIENAIIFIGCVLVYAVMYSDDYVSVMNHVFDVIKCIDCYDCDKKCMSNAIKYVSSHFNVRAYSILVNYYKNMQHTQCIRCERRTNKQRKFVRYTCGNICDCDGKLIFNMAFNCNGCGLHNKSDYIAMINQVDVVNISSVIKASRVDGKFDIELFNILMSKCIHVHVFDYGVFDTLIQDLISIDATKDDIEYVFNYIAYVKKRNDIQEVLKNIITRTRNVKYMQLFDCASFITEDLLHRVIEYNCVGSETDIIGLIQYSNIHITDKLMKALLKHRYKGNNEKILHFIVYRYKNYSIGPLFADYIYNMHEYNDCIQQIVTDTKYQFNSDFISRLIYDSCNDYPEHTNMLKSMLQYTNVVFKDMVCKHNEDARIKLVKFYPCRCYTYTCLNINNIDILFYLITIGKACKQCLEASLKTVLDLLFKHKYRAGVDALFNIVGANSYIDGIPLLIYCAYDKRYNNNLFAKYLIHKGANVNCTDKYGYKPIHYAVMYENMALIDMLIEANACIDNESNMLINIVTAHNKQHVLRYLHDKDCINDIVCYDYDVKYCNVKRRRIE